MGATNETDKSREQTAKEPENASHLPDKLVAQKRKIRASRAAEALSRGEEAAAGLHRAEPSGAVVQGFGPVARKVAVKRWMQRGIA